MIFQSYTPTFILEPFFDYLCNYCEIIVKFTNNSETEHAFINTLLKMKKNFYVYCVE